MFDIYGVLWWRKSFFKMIYVSFVVLTLSACGVSDQPDPDNFSKPVYSQNNDNPLSNSSVEDVAVSTIASIPDAASRIEIALETIEEWPARSYIPTLQVGQHAFTKAVVRKEGNAIIFALTPEEFALLQDGDIVQVYFGMPTSDDRFFGALNKTRLHMVEHVDAPLEAVINELRVLQLEIPDSAIKSDLGQVIEELESTRGPGIWRDHSRIELQQGEAVFNSWNQAILHLKGLEDAVAGIGGSGVFSGPINRVLYVARGVAATAANDLERGGFPPETVTTARSLLSAGGVTAGESHGSDALTHYYHSWRYTIRVLFPDAAPPPRPDELPAATPTPGLTETCDIYPIAVPFSLLADPNSADMPILIQGTNPGNFGWLSWTGAQGVPDLIDSLTPPGTSRFYVNPRDGLKQRLVEDRWVRGQSGAGNSRGVRDALDALVGRSIIVPVWDEVEKRGSKLEYHITGFIQIQVMSYDLRSEHRIVVRYEGEVFCSE